jgi:hypothetical protein
MIVVFEISKPLSVPPKLRKIAIIAKRTAPSGATVVLKYIIKRAFNLENRSRNPVFSKNRVSENSLALRN